MGYNDKQPIRGRGYDDFGDERDVSSGRKIAELAAYLETQDFPMKAANDDVVDALFESAESGSNVFFLEALAGSGKTGYGPSALIEMLKRRGIEHPRVIGAEPRRDATVAAANLNAAVRKAQVGRDVGYSTGEGRRIQPTADLFFVTPRILLRYFFEGKINKNINGLFVDEAHDRSVDYDMICGALELLRRKGQAPFTVFTSARVNPGLKQFFDLKETDTMQVEGRRFPIETRYYPPEFGVEEEPQGFDYLNKIMFKMEQICDSGKPGDILVFLPGEPEIKKIMNEYQGTDRLHAELLPLYGKLKQEERQKVIFDKQRTPGRRRVILSTNYAESSYTLPQVRFVIDSCRKKVSYYDPETHTDHLVTEFVSQDEADQRAARSGRVANGEVHRAVTEETYKKFKKHPQSEIHRVNLSLYILRLKSLGINFEDFPLPEMPVQSAIDAGRKELQALGAMDEHGELTDLGREIAETTFEPRVARMVIEGKRRGKLLPALVMAAFSRESTVFHKKGNQSGFGHAWGDSGWISKDVQSDWYRNIQVMKGAIRHGVFELVKESHEGALGYRAIDFRRWCEEENLNPNALKHIATRLKDFAELVGVNLESEDLFDTLQQTKESDITPLLLTAYADCLLAKGLEDIKYHRLREQGASNILVGESSAAYDKNPQLCVATEITVPKGSFASYANGVHPVSLAEVREILKQFITIGAPHHYEYNKTTGTVVAFFPCEYKVPGMDRGVFLADEKGEVHDEKAARLFIQNQILEPRMQNSGQRTRGLSNRLYADARWEQEMYGGGDDFDPESYGEKDFVGGFGGISKIDSTREYLEKIHADNLGALDELRKLFTRSGGAFHLPSEVYVDWYLSKLKKTDGTYVSSVGEAKSILEQLKFKPEVYCSAEQHEKIDREFPAFVQIQGEQYRVGYGLSNEQHSISINYPIEKLLKLSQSDIPTFGPPEQTVPCTVQVRSGFGKVFSGIDVEELKKQAEPTILEEVVFPEWKKTQQQRTQFIQEPFRTLPEIEAVQFATNLSGQPVYAYRGLRFERSWGGRAYQHFFYRRHDAEAAMKEVKDYQKQIEEGEIQNFTEIQKLRDLAGRVETRIQSLSLESEKYGLPDDAWIQLLNGKLEYVKGQLVTKSPDEKFDYRLLSSHRSRLDEILRIIEARPAAVERRRVLLPEIERARDMAQRVVKIIEAIVPNDAQWNIGATQIKLWSAGVELALKQAESDPADALFRINRVEKEIEQRKKQYEELESLWQMVRNMANIIFIDQAEKYKASHEVKSHAKLIFDTATRSLHGTLVSLETAQTNLQQVFYLLDDFLNPEVAKLRREALALVEKSPTSALGPAGKIIHIEHGKLVRGLEFPDDGRGGAVVYQRNNGEKLLFTNNRRLSYINRNGDILYSYNLPDGIYVVDKTASNVIELEMELAGAVRPFQKLEKEFTERGNAEAIVLLHAQKKYGEVESLLAGLNGKGDIYLGTFERNLSKLEPCIYDITQAEEALKGLKKLEDSINEAIAEQEKKIQKQEKQFDEVKKLYQHILQTASRFLDEYTFREEYEYSGRSVFRGVRKDEFERALRNWQQLKPICTQTQLPNTTSIESVQNQIRTVFEVLSKLEIWDRSYTDRENERQIRLLEDMNKNLRQGQILFMSADKRVERATTINNLAGGNANPKIIYLGSSGEQLKCDFEGGMVALLRDRRILFTYNLAYGECFVVSYDGYQMMEVRPVPMGLFEFVRVVDAEQYMPGNLQVRDERREALPPRREPSPPPRREPPPFGRGSEGFMSVGRFGDRSRTFEAPPRQVFGSPDSVGSSALADVLMKFKAENPVSPSSDHLTPTSAPAEEVKKQMDDKGEKIMTEELRAALIGDLELIEIILLEIASVRHGNDKAKIKLMSDGEKITERLGDITAMVKSSNDVERARSSVAGTLGEVKRIAKKLNLEDKLKGYL